MTSWLTGWNYRKPITVSNTGSALTDYQVSITVDTATLVTAGKLLSSCNDIRFTSSDGSNLLNYWIESGCNTSSTKIWVKIPSISPGSNTIYLYYNNTGASSVSSGINTFVVFDDFATGSSEQWTMTGVTADRTTNHKLNINGVTGSTSAYLDKGADIGNYEFLYTYTRTSGAAAGFGAGTGDIINSNIDASVSKNAVAGLDHPGSSGTQYKYLQLYQGTTNYGTSVTAGASNVLYYGKLTRLNDVYTYTVYSDATRTSQVWSMSATKAGLTSQRYIYAVITTLDISHTSTGWLKDIRIRKYTATEPTTCIGGEEVSTVLWLTGWNRRKLLTITGSTAGAQTDYQMKLIVHKATGTDTSTDIYLGTNVNNDLSDLRFTSNNGSTLLSYWIESYTSGSVATVWIKIPSIPANPCTTTIYTYYDNSSASTLSNGTNTFIDFCKDDLTGFTILDNEEPSIGTTTPSNGGSVTIVNGKINFNVADVNGTGMSIYGKSPTTETNTITEFYVTSFTGNLWSYMRLLRNSDHTYGYLGVRTNPSPSNIWYRVHNSSMTSLGVPNYNYGGIWHFKKLNTTYITGFNGVDFSGSTSVDELGANAYIFSFEAFSSGVSSEGIIVLDWIRMRKYISPEPTFSSSGAEQTAPNIGATAMSISPSETPCRTGICTVTTVVRWSNSGGIDGTVIPNIKIDNISQIAHAPRTVIAGSYIDETFIISGLSAGTHSICPDPN